MAGVMGKGRGRGRRNNAQMCDINITPFVDVVLVLLIVFMVAAPLLTVAIPVDLPEAQASAVNEPEEPLVVSINGKGEIFVQETPVEFEKMAPLLMAVSKNNQEARIFVRGDQMLNYGRIMQVMGGINEAGFTKVALVAQWPDQK